MFRVAATLALALSLFGCAARGEQVPLPTDTAQTAFGNGCILMYQIVDVIADPETGTPVVKGGQPVSWPTGFTAWRVGTETEVVSGTGSTVLRTGGRYAICPSQYLDGWVVGMLHPCPAGEVVPLFGGWKVKCDIGGGVM
jgi:hypothetical protein